MAADVLLDVRDLHKRFTAPAVGWWSKSAVSALIGVGFTLRRGEVLGLVGESGSGKSTLALVLAGLERSDAGTILFEGEDIAQIRGSRRKALHRHIQLIFQDPYQALHPLHRVGAQVAEPLAVHRLVRDRRERLARVQTALEEVGLAPAGDFLARYPHQLSGGQRQRVAIAAALVLEPRLLIADEPVAMLDAASRDALLVLLNKLRIERGIAILLISHDIATTARLADRLAVMQRGRIVETGPTQALLRRPEHPYTQALVAAISGVGWTL